MSENIVRHKCKCVECGDSHWRFERQEELPVGIHCVVKPWEEDDKSWELLIYDYSRKGVVIFECVSDSMKGVLWNIENVGMSLRKVGYRIVVDLPGSRFETHSRINRVQWNDYVARETTEAKEHWYAAVVRKACRQNVRAANRVARVGYKK